MLVTGELLDILEALVPERVVDHMHQSPRKPFHALGMVIPGKETSSLFVHVVVSVVELYNEFKSSCIPVSGNFCLTGLLVDLVFECGVLLLVGHVLEVHSFQRFGRIARELVAVAHLVFDLVFFSILFECIKQESSSVFPLAREQSSDDALFDLLVFHDVLPLFKPDKGPDVDGSSKSVGHDALTVLSQAPFHLLV